MLKQTEKNMAQKQPVQQSEGQPAEHSEEHPARHSQRRTDNSNHGALQVLNVLSLVAGLALLVAFSWEILAGDPRHYSGDYLLLQGVVCIIFLADFFAQMWASDRRWHFFFSNLYFLLLSIPYLNIIRWTGLELTHEQATLVSFVPLLRALLGLYVVFRWLITSRVTRLFTSYVLSIVVFTYFAALIFYDYEINVNPQLHTFMDAVWWACMNVTTIGAQIYAVTTIGKILTVVLPILGMLLFPVFTVYVTQIYNRKPKGGSEIS